MRFKQGQTIRINKDFISNSLDHEAIRLSPPYVSTIDYLQTDPHTGREMYMLSGTISGWYEEEILGLYCEEDKKTRFDLMIFDELDNELF